MIERILRVAQIAACIGFTAVCIFICTLVVQVRHTVSTLEAKVTLDLDEAHRLELEAGLTAMEARKASADERKAIPKITNDVDGAIHSLTALLNTARVTTAGVGTSQQQITQSTVATLDSTNKTIQGLQPVIEQANASLAEVNRVAADVDRQINDPAIMSTIHHVDGTAAAVEASAKDVQAEVHAITHPTWLHRAWGWALDVAHVFNPL